MPEYVFGLIESDILMTNNGDDATDHEINLSPSHINTNDSGDVLNNRHQRIISLPPPKPTPPFLCRLFDGNGGVRNSKFKEQIRIYNSLFQFTSLGGIVDNSINQRPGPYVFKLSGQNYHRMGSLLPFAGQTSKFAQLYMIESDAELDCRMSCFRFNDGIQGLDNDIVCGLRNMLDEYNEIVKVFRSAREVHMQFRELPVRIKLIANQNKKDHNYSAPSVPEIAALIVGDIGNNDQGRDIIVEHKQEGLKRISDLHPLFMPLQYPLLFPYGEDCFHLNIPYEESPIRSIETTMFTEWMATNKLDERGRSLLYTDFPTKFTWYKKEKKWKYRMNDRSIGRIIYIHPSAGELYYLCLLLNEIKGARSYEDLRTINNVVYTTYREACFALGILGDDSEWSNALIQAAHWATSTQLRQLFVTIILYCDKIYTIDFDRHSACLIILFQTISYLYSNTRSYKQQWRNVFVYGHGGTGKTFLWNTIINGIRTEGKIVLAVASSGIASLLLPGGRTAHSRFKIPINIEECSTCKISKQTQLARLIEKTTLIVWDEALMVHRNCLEALNKTLQDILSEITPEAYTKPFGGKTIIEIPQYLLVENLGNPTQSIIEAIYPQFQLNYAKTEYLRQRAIVTPYNETVDILNETISNEIEVDEQKYLSSDYISKASTSADANAPLYTTEFLNTLKFTSIPNHELTLKIGCQLPVKLSYAMTINKSQGQTLELVGLFLPKPVFSHGQLYVTLSWVSSVEGLKVLILGDNGKNTNKTKNVVYKEIFDSIEINSDPGR
ncbi:DNA helicase protein [Dioscorea alata]|uniref:DNA helicase protein n=1 Tax=Dioscorea alata TaxID=55571 RepID=A0ACB7UZ75_DIOAL|nr:DNA helicase protein [Dioscorea alata]